jgi:two-component system, NtrC family, sensor kinase
LAEEYLTLAYHGIRARDKSLPAGEEGFQATLQTNFDSGIDKINILPQDIGKVLLNLYNNAFYTVLEKKKIYGAAYEPIISISTNRRPTHIDIKLKDNGMGMSENVKEKIFQPFFTTKPTGQGTGLGLSMSYDIIKAHGGELKVETKEGEFTEFIISLPLT